MIIELIIGIGIGFIPYVDNFGMLDVYVCVLTLINF